MFEQNGKQFERVVWGGESRSVTELLYEGRRFLLKLHGDAEDSTDRVLTKSEYLKQYGSEDAFPINLSLPLPHLLQAILKYRPLLFLGCSLNQDRTVHVLEQVSQQFQYIKPYAVVEKPKSEQRFYERALFLSNHNIRPIWYPEGKHGCIELLLKYLAEKSAFTVSQFLLSMKDQNLLSLRQPSPDNSTYLTSALPVLIGSDGANTTYDFAVIDLGEGKEWVTSRLFIFAIILERFFNIRCFVFLETLQGAPEQFIGIASPDEVRWRLARKYPWLEEAFAKAYCSQMPSIKHFFNRQRYSSWPFEPRVPGIESLVKFFRQIDLVHSAGDSQVTKNLIESFRDLVDDFQKDEHIEPHDLKIESAHGALDPQLATPVALDFLRGIQAKDPPDKGGWVPLKWHDDGKDIERWERAQWLDKHLLEGILDASLQKDSWVPYDPPAGQAKAVLRREGRFIALVEGERRFKMLVDRRTFLEREVARLEVMDDEKPR